MNPLTRTSSPGKAGASPRALFLAFVTALLLALPLGATALAAETTPAPEAESTPAQAPAADATVIRESGLVIEAPSSVYFAEDEWWTYMGDGEAMYFRTYAGVDPTAAPDVTLGAPDETWAATLVTDTYEYLGAVPYENDSVTFYAYYYRDGDDPQTPYVDFRAYVPLPDGSITAIAGFFRSPDAATLLEMVDSIFATVELDAGGTTVASTVSGNTLTCGDFTFELPSGVEFELETSEDGSIVAAYQGPDAASFLMAFSIETDGVVITSVEELQQAGDSFMSGVAEGAEGEGGELLEGSVFTNDQSIAYYHACYISGEMDASFVLAPYSGRMMIIAIFDAGSTDDFSFANDMLFEIAGTINMAANSTAASDAGSAATEAPADDASAEGSEGAESADADGSSSLGEGLGDFSDIFGDFPVDEITVV